MYKWRLLALLVLQLLCTSTFAQGEANIWYFGVNAGLDFNYNPPIALTNSAMVAYEGTAVLSDSLGQLLFYTDGMTVWNRQHNMLLNGYDLLGGTSTTQSALIIPKPGSSSLFYIFTIEQAENITWRLSYSEVDMQLDGGLGGVTSNKNIVLFSPIGEKITAVKHANNEDIWIISHDKFTNRYLIFQLTNSGVNPNPTILNAGSVDNSSPFGIISPNTGYLKASPLGDKIACAYTDVNKVDILNFNNATGTLSYEYTINNIDYPYGVEFSQNGSILYVSGIIPSVIKQYNLSLANPTTIMATAFTIPIEQSPWSSAYSIQLGIDGKIYCSRYLSNFLDCIQSPDNIGSSCDYLANAIYLNGKNTQLGLPNFAPYLLTPPQINAIGNCSGDTVYFSLENAAAFDSVQWDFGDLNSGDLNYSNSINPIHIYQSGGTYQVSLVTFNGNQIDTLERTVNLYQTPNVSFPSDTLFCYLSNLLLYAGVGDDYVWQDGTSNPTFNVYTPGIYYVTASNFCGLSSDTVNVNVSYGSFGVNLGEDLNICEGNQVSFDMLQQTNSTYLWQDGSTNSQFTITQSGEYYVSVSNVCGTTSDTVIAVVNPLPSVFLGDDIFVCNESSVQLIANGIADTYLWSDGNTNSSITVTSPGTYSVTVTNSCGSKTDSIVVSTGSPTTGFININECEAFIINGITYSTSGEFTQVLQNAIGCDSTLTINAEILDFNAQIFQQDSTLYFNGNPTSIQWINCSTGQAIPGATETSFVPQTTGNYGAIITIGECVDSSNCRQIIQSSMPEKPGSLCDNLIVTPNPVNDQIEFTLDKSSYDIRLFTSTGALVLSAKGNAQKQIINFQDLARAMYVLQVDECRFKIVKQ